ncbi:L-histidine N(alpha)-methyltransferase [Nocardioidaceae bacterium]|nr:L-histidine N(alpha)-methyltransferase [Nocardioidaceae bacterium]
MSTDLDVRLDPATLVDQMADDVRAGLGERPYTLPPKYFYDAEGSRLFDEITRLEEYYPTRTERAILVATVAEIAAATGARTLVELGSGTSEKTRLLLGALRGAGTLEQFVPFDVDPVILGVAAAQVDEEFPGLVVSPVVGDFDHHLHDLPGAGPRLVAFLGSTLGNFDPTARTRFFRDVRGSLAAGDHLLLGIDLVKDSDRLVAAYDDARGVTAAFNTNVLHVLNREQKADFDVDAFEHVAVWDADNEWIEMRLRSLRDQTVRIEALDLDVTLAAGEEIRTEISAKFRRERLAAELAAADLRIEQWWTDESEDFALTLIAPA